MPLPTRLNRGLAAAAATLALNACTTVGPDFVTPDAPRGPAAEGYAMAGDPAAPWVQLSPDARVAGPWWQAFQSAELDRTIRQALADSPSVDEAAATLERAQAQLAAERGAELPQIDAKGGARTQRVNTESFGFTGFPSRTLNLFSIGGSVSYDLDLFGGRRRRVESAAARADAEARRADAAYLALSGNVALQAMRIAALRAEIVEVRGIVAADRRVIGMIQKAQAAGGEARSALSVSVGQLAEDEALLPPLERALAAARHQMALLVGKSPAAYRAPDFELAALASPATVPISLPSDLVRRRPDILAAEADLHTATAAIGVAVANQYPNIRLSADLTQTTTQPEKLFSYSASGWNLASGVTAPLFDGGTLKARGRVAEAEARIALSRYQQTVMRAFVQVSDVLAALASDQDGIESLKQANAAAESGLRDAETAYRLGGGPLIDVAHAQRTLSRARRAMVQIQGQRYIDLVQLYVATAADWRTS